MLLPALFFLAIRFTPSSEQPLSAIMNDSILDAQSLQTLAAQVPDNISWMAVSPFIFGTNFLIILTISVSKPLHNKSHFIVLSYSISECIYSLCYFCAGLIRYLAYFYGRPETSTQLMCILKQVPLNSTGHVVTLFTLTLALDRFLCVRAPVFYKTRRTLNYVLALNLFCWCGSMAKVPFAFLSYDPYKKFPVCTLASSFSQSYVTYSTAESGVAVALTAALYAATASILLYRYKNTKFVSSNEKREWRRQMDLDVCVAMSAVGALYVITYGTRAVLTAIVTSKLSLELNQKIIPFSTALFFGNAASHLFVYLILNKVFRKNFFRIFCRRNDNAVSSFVG